MRARQNRAKIKTGFQVRAQRACGWLHALGDAVASLVMTDTDQDVWGIPDTE
jgi:hypothetical protein